MNDTPDAADWRLTDARWSLVESVLPPQATDRQRQRIEPRHVFEAVLHTLMNDRPWYAVTREQWQMSWHTAAYYWHMYAVHEVWSHLEDAAVGADHRAWARAVAEQARARLRRYPVYSRRARPPAPSAIDQVRRVMNRHDGSAP